MVLTFIKKSCIDCRLLRSKFLVGKVSEHFTTKRTITKYALGLLLWVTGTNSWNNNLVAAFTMRIIWFVDFILNTIRFTCMTKVPKYIEFNKMFQVRRRNFKLYNFELECGFCSLICFIVSCVIKHHNWLIFIVCHVWRSVSR